MPRRTGPRAVLGVLRAELFRAEASGDTEREREVAQALSRALAARGTELDTATQLARRALMLGEDATLRDELSSWFAGLGEHRLAAATLRPLSERADPEVVAQSLTRIAVLLARAGDRHAAASALERAIEHGKDPLVAELLGSIQTWIGDPDAAARAYLEAARRRESQAERVPAFEDLVRAFELSPGFPPAAELLSATLDKRGRSGAAAEVLREHAKARGAPGRTIHIQRLNDAVARDDLPRALSCAFDANLDAEIDARALVAQKADVGVRPAIGMERPAFYTVSEPVVVSLDELLRRAGLHEIVAARLELACVMLAGPDRSRGRLLLGRLYAGPLGSTSRAVDAWVDAVVHDPGCEEAKAALRHHAVEHDDYLPLVEALVRAANSGAHGVVPQKSGCLRELFALAEDKLSHPGLALWAVQRLRAVEQEDAELEAAAQRLEARAKLADTELRALEAELETRSDDTRIGTLEKIAAVLWGLPQKADRYRDVLVELCARLSDAGHFRRRLRWLLRRMDRLDELAELLKAGDGVDATRTSLELARVYLHEGQFERALELLAPLVEGDSGLPAAWALALILAARAQRRGLRALALMRLALPLTPALRAMLGSVAAEELLEAGDVEAALAAAEQACRADPSLARPASVRAAVELARSPRTQAEPLERATGMLVPRAAWCAAVADIYEALGEPQLSLAWTQRLLALRPGDIDVIQLQLRRVSELSDAQRLSDALSWLLSQPQPLASLSETLATALRKLAGLDPGRGAALARRALDVLGARDPELRSTLLTVSDLIGERGLSLAVLERWLAAGAPGEARGELLLDLAARRKHAGDADGAARALVRALEEGVAPRAILDALETALPARSPDGELSMLEARAEALSRSPDIDAEVTARALREFGAAVWDLAGHVDAALSAWRRAAALAPERGVARLATDLVAFAGHQAAVTHLEAIAGEYEAPAQAANVLAAAAAVALHAGLSSQALGVATRALELDPSRADVLAVVERAASSEDTGTLELVYERLASVALGCYGERAVHYRAARQFERRRLHDLAFGHAVKAFEAVPSEGVAFVLMTRLADQSGKLSEVVRALERVASGGGAEQRSAWLRRAALLSGDDVDGQRQRIEVLLRALSASPDIETLRSLGGALKGLLRLSPDDRESLELRFTRAIASLLRRAEGVTGARLCVLSASIGLEVFDAPELSFPALERAFDCDLGIDEYGTLCAQAARLSSVIEPARALVSRALELGRHDSGAGSAAVFEVSARIAAGLGQKSDAAWLFIFAATRAPDDRGLAEQAEACAREAGEPELAERVLSIAPPRLRISALIEQAREAETSGDVPMAVRALERVLGEPDLGEDKRAECVVLLKKAYGRAGHREALERLLVQELERAERQGRPVPEEARELSALLFARGDLSRALQTLRSALEHSPDEAALLRDLVLLARQGEDDGQRVWAVERLLDQPVAVEERVPLLRELASLLDQKGEQARGLVRWQELGELSPGDPQVLSALERDAERRGDYAAVADLLGRRAAGMLEPDERRRLRLRRASVLEQRLARPEQARSELEALLADAPDDLSVLRVLADLNARLGAPLAAAPLWLRASQATQDRKEAADLAYRACEAYLSGDALDEAQRVLDAIDPEGQEERRLTLSVDVARRREDPESLGSALFNLAESRERSEDRVPLLIESARAALAAGDEAKARERARLAASLAPGSAEARLLAAWLDYLARGPGSVEEARITVTELRALGEELGREQRELATFLIAESIDVAIGRGAGQRELERARQELGASNLVALGLAERYLALGESGRALEQYAGALDGDLRRLRSRGQVALQAAELSLRCRQYERAEAYLETAAADPTLRTATQRLSDELRKEREVERGRLSGTQVSPGRYSGRPPTSTSEERLRSPTALGPGAALSAADPSASGLRAEPGDAPARVEAFMSTMPSDAPPMGPPSVPQLTRRSSSLPVQPVLIPMAIRGLDSRTSSAGLPIAPGQENELWVELEHGSLDAGRELIQLLEQSSDRAHDLVTVCRRVVRLAPYEIWALEKLRGAAAQDRDPDYALALDHVLRTLAGGSAPPVPAPLDDQPAQPSAVRGLLFRDLPPVFEALSLVWEGAEHVFRRDPATYGVTGLERVSLSSPMPLGRVYAEAARALGLTRAALFARRTAGQTEMSLALLSNPAVVVDGDPPPDTPALRFYMGKMLAATLPSFVLLMGSTPAEARTILGALALAFGPPASDRGDLAAVASLAEVLWESIPGRSQRRLRELCGDAHALDHDQAIWSMGLALRRAGLYVSGDLGVSLVETSRELGIVLPRASEELVLVIRRDAALQDLVRLASAAEFAEMRWRTRGRRSS